jgi:hypothetical protein
MAKAKAACQPELEPAPAARRGKLTAASNAGVRMLGYRRKSCHSRLFLACREAVALQEGVPELDAVLDVTETDGVPLLERVADADGDAVCEGVPVSKDVPLDDAVVEDNAVVELEGVPHSKTSGSASKGKKSEKDEKDDTTIAAEVTTRVAPGHGELSGDD